MRNLDEKVVQDRAIELLRLRYNAQKTPSSRLFCRDEVVTNEGKRADGFLCFNQTNQKYYVVSLEAKSHKTLGAIVPIWNNSRLRNRILLYSSIAQIPIVFLIRDLNWYWIIVSVIATVVLIGISYIAYSGLYEPSRHMSLNVLNQIAQYPANEQWLAVSKDSLQLAVDVKNGIETDNEKMLRSICEKKGIGLIIVDRKTARVVIAPRARKGDFLFRYATAPQVKTVIDNYGNG